jgi:predicted O-methyltransferase YrrM
MICNLIVRSTKEDDKNKVANEIKKTVSALLAKDYMNALSSLDLLCEIKHSKTLYYTRAIIRSLVMDLNGSLMDLDKLETQNEESNLLRANVFSKMGNIDESISIIKKLQSKAGIGIAGRRTDLFLLGFIDGAIPDHKLEGWEVGCVAGHLLTLAEWETLERALEFMDTNDCKNYADVLKELKEDGCLFDRGSRKGVSEEIENTLGWFSADESEYIADLARKVPADANIVEIGSFCGRSTISLVIGSQQGNNSKVHSVDPHLGLTSIYIESTLPIFVMNLKKRNLLPYVNIHREYSAELAKSWSWGTIGLLFIDAEHSYKSVYEDFNSWYKYLMDGALVVFHDYPQKGPNKLLREILTNKTEFFPHSFMDGLFVIQYRPNARNSDLARNQAFVNFLELIGRDYDYWVNSEEERSAKKVIDLLDKFEKGGDIL